MERIALTNAAFEGDNNAYLFADGPETVLVDAGDWMAGTREELEAGLATHGVGFADIDRLLLSHWHPDHTGLAGQIQDASDAEVFVHEADAPLVSGDPDAWAAMRDAQEHYFEAWDIPEAEQAILHEIMGGLDDIDRFPAVESFTDGATFTVNGTELRAVHAPGHAAGLCMFAFEGERGHEVFTGDALLPVYTPNVGGADVRVDDALAKYLRTLDAIVAADYDRAWPGHRQPIEDPSARAAEIITHHEERSYRVLAALADLGPTTPWTVSAELFGNLADIHILHGPGESVAHLEHLVDAGDVVRDGHTYDLADGVAAKVAAREDGAWPLSY
jgi:glyoxylase-like metal-dependent hydrolase (beta-lactamase superfamily II)